MGSGRPMIPLPPRPEPRPIVGNCDGCGAPKTAGPECNYCGREFYAMANRPRPDWKVSG